jgi:hypothetical protein
VDVINQNGTVEVAGVAPKGANQQCNSITIKTSFAPIRVSIPDGAGYTVAARTSFGKIQSDPPLTVTGAVSATLLNGTIGNGECKLNLTNGNGNILILRAGKLP